MKRKTTISIDADLFNQIEKRRQQDSLTSQIEADLSWYYAFLDFQGRHMKNRFDLKEAETICKAGEKLSLTCRNINRIADYLCLELVSSGWVGADKLIEKIRALSVPEALWLWDRILLFRGLTHYNDNQLKSLFHITGSG